MLKKKLEDGKITNKKAEKNKLPSQKCQKRVIQKPQEQVCTQK